ncbi:hypothetical protein [Oscillibacter sp.]|uniref:hypothetical protein n=1 Tax=Oscillibacter sp. TaxID=1945593 RepID=UPI0028996A13|nr:hypothetical protein [Oscillibacter sp.]
MAGERIGLRYCGGCNPRFDRVALVEQVQICFPEDIFELADASSGQSAVLVIHGCPSNCVNVTDLEGLPLVTAGYQDTPEDVSRRLWAALRRPEKKRDDAPRRRGRPRAIPAGPDTTK